jgi:uncharacterized membrane protein
MPSPGDGWQKCKTMALHNNSSNAAISTACPESVLPMPADFRFRITPHRSMSDRGFSYVIFIMLTLAVTTQVFFLAIGIWVAGVAALLNGLFLAAAFIACRADRNNMETVSLHNGMLSIMRKRGNGELVFTRMVPAFGLTISTTVDPDFGCRKLELQHRSHLTEVGRDLSPAERRSFVTALVNSLHSHGFAPQLLEHTTPALHQN